jgi:Xaa-Pro aminopeptidase
MPAAIAAEADATTPAATPAAVERVAKIQAALQAAGIDGWLFYDFRGINPIANRMLLLPGGGIATRRWLYFVPATGTPVRIVHAIEPHRLDHLPGTKSVYGAWSVLQDAIRTALAGKKKIAMEYSPDGGIPYLARVDAGTVDFVRSTGATVVSSGGLLEQFEAVWTPAQKAQHDRAATALRQIINEAWAQIAKATRAGEFIDERIVQEQCGRRAEELGLVKDLPIVAVNANAANPHYFPLGPRSTPIKRGDLVLIDITGKLREPNAVQADITWIAVVDDKVPERFEKIWTIVAAARDAAVEFIRARAASGQLPLGCEVDDVARGVITKAGYGPQFLHRTGHSIDLEVHGNGTHMDNFETRDERHLVPHTCFSIEPGIYLEGDFGIRSEVDVYLDGMTPVITGGPAQKEIIPILALPAK